MGMVNTLAGARRGIIRLALGAAMIAGCAAFMPAAATAQTTVTIPRENPDYVALFRDYDNRFNDGLAASGNVNTTGSLAWLQSYQFLAYMQMYRATEDTHWLDRVATQFSRIMKNRDDRIGTVDVHAKKPLKGWSAAGRYSEAGPHVFIVHTGMICTGPAEFVRVVKENPALHEKYGDTADKFLTELQEIVDQANEMYFVNDDSTTAGEGYWTDPVMGVMPTNMSAAMGNLVLELYLVTDREDYKDKVTRFATFLKNSMQPAEHDAYLWAYWPKKSNDEIKQGEDVSHAALNVEFASRCTSAGIVFTKEDMRRIGNTWLHHVRQNDGTYATHVDGSSHGRYNAYYPQSPGRWLRIIPHLPQPMAREMYKGVVEIFAGEDVSSHYVSRAYGLANLALYGKTLR